jgi:hypothetical protein
VQRLINAIQKKSQKGVNYEISDELLGFIGFRKVPLDIERNLNFKIAAFQESKRNEARKIFENLRTGDPVTDPNAVIRQYFEANKSFYEDMSKLRRVYDAVKTLGMRDKEIAKEFNDRGEIPLYSRIENNKFSPLVITRGQIAGLKELSKDKKIPDIVNKKILKIISRMRKDMNRLRLNKDFDLDLNKYLIKPQQTSELLITPNIPTQVSDAAPNPNVVNSGQMAQLNEGLTRTENALLTEEEKAIKLRERGMTA